MTAHPRSRGEHSGAVALYATTRGSSPLTRGAQPGAKALVCLLGLIPAHAGSTPCLGGESNPTRAHPRSRGEHTTGAITEQTNEGSSPLTRGAPGVNQERFCS